MACGSYGEGRGSGGRRTRRGCCRRSASRREVDTFGMRLRSCTCSYRFHIAGRVVLSWRCAVEGSCSLFISAFLLSFFVLAWPLA